MQTDIVNIGLGFLEGFALIVSPCILPILPIMLSGSLTGSKKRPIGIVIGFVLFFSLFTFFSRIITQYSGIDSNIIRHIAYGILFIFGIILFSSYLTEKLAQITRRLTTIGSTLNQVNNPQGGLFSGILFGGLVAIIWTPCAGPILAAVIVQIAIQKSTLMSFFTLMAFSLGAAVPMLIIAILGRSISSKLNFFKKHVIFFRKMLGLIIILSVIYMILTEGGISTAQANELNNHSAPNLQNALKNSYPAPKIDGIDAWINSAPLSLDQLKGKVILIDFWTYSCINCVRTLPYLKNWYNKYHSQGFMIIGVHSPEFDFEKNFNNVKNAVLQNKILYPVALDNHFVTWQNFNNRYWPAHYLIDQKGYVVYTHFGEGDYDITENNIRTLLNMEKIHKNINENTQFEAETPETYLGYDRAESFSSPENVKQDLTANYTFPKNLSLNQWALQGNWEIFSDRIVSNQQNAMIQIHFQARKVFMVMGSTTNQTIKVNLLLNGKNVQNSNIIVNKHTLYQIVSFDKIQNGILTITSSSPGLELYTFTFG